MTLKNKENKWKMKQLKLKLKLKKAMKQMELNYLGANPHTDAKLATYKTFDFARIYFNNDNSNSKYNIKVQQQMQKNCFHSLPFQ